MAADAKSTAGDMALAAMKLRIAEEESRRWQAAKKSEDHFISVLPLTRRQSCVRSSRLYATLVLASSVELQAAGHQPEPEGLTAVRVTSKEERLVELMSVATPLLQMTFKPSSAPVETDAEVEKENTRNEDRGDDLL